jgi:hypothetical protein
MTHGDTDWSVQGRFSELWAKFINEVFIIPVRRKLEGLIILIKSRRDIYGRLSHK